jgi:hypothetical protein
MKRTSRIGEMHTSLLNFEVGGAGAEERRDRDGAPRRRRLRRFPARPIIVAGVAGLLLVGGASARVRTVEDWSAHAAGARGVPAGWKPVSETVSWLERQVLSRAGNDFQVVASGAGKALRMKSDSEHSIIVKGLRGLEVNLVETPLLEWTWRVDVLPRGADLGVRSRSDSAAELHVVWSARKRTIGYSWDETRPVGSFFENPRFARVFFLIVSSGPARPGEWVSVTRDVVADHQAIYGSEPSEPPDRIALSIDSNQTRSTAEAYLGRIAFRAR